MRPAILESSIRPETGKTTADSIDITYYTDPLCCWSWAFEPEWNKLLCELKGRLTYRYVMGGLLPQWNNYHDPLHSVSRPAQMGPVWMHARQVSGVEMYDRIWMEDPPASSYPACIAVKCASLQSFEAGEAYLRQVRVAGMAKGINVAKPEALLAIADELSEKSPAVFNKERFALDMQSEECLEGFRRDLQEVKYRSITRFPSLILRRPEYKPIMVTGFRPYKVLTDIIEHAFEKEI